MLPDRVIEYTKDFCKQNVEVHMITMRPFRAIRPSDNVFAKRIAALPYDVMSADEARKVAKKNAVSFLHIDKAEIDFEPGVDPYSDAVYAKAKENYDALISRDALIRDDTPCFYLYHQTWNGRTQSGIVGCLSVNDYLENRVKKHELTRADKEADRIRHVDTLNANTGPIFLARRENTVLENIQSWYGIYGMRPAEPIYDFVTGVGKAAGSVRHTVFRIFDPDTVAAIEKEFRNISALYIADGHHRCASAARVATMRRETYPEYNGTEEFNYFLAVVFAAGDLTIMDYNRVVKDLNGLTPSAFIEELKKLGSIRPVVSSYRPTKKHEFGIYLARKWYCFTPDPCTIDDSNPVASLDASWLQERVLAPILGIGDPREDNRIDFVGGIRGIPELRGRVRKEPAEAVGFALSPVTMNDLLAVADAGKIMPPKSTWFEPKLLSGLLIHEL